MTVSSSLPLTDTGLDFKSRASQEVAASMGVSAQHLGQLPDRPLRTLHSFLAVNSWRYIFYFILFLIKNAPTWIWPLVLSAFVAILSDPTAYPKWSLPALIIAVFVIQIQNIPMHVWYVRLTSRHIRDLEMRLRSGLVRSLQYLSISYHHQSKSGRLQAKVLRDVERVILFTTHISQSGMDVVVSLVTAFIITLVKEPSLAFFYMVSAPICVALVKFFQGKIKASQREYRQKLEGMSSEVGEMITMTPVIRAHGLEHEAVNRTDQHLFEVRGGGLRLDLINSVFASSNFVTMQVSQTLSLAVTGYMCYHGSISIAELVLYQGLFGIIVHSLMAMLYQLPIITEGYESLQSLGEILSCDDLEQNEGKKEVSSVQGSIQFDHVEFSYNSRDRHALKDFNLIVNPGDCIAFVGESGSGKSTVMNLLLGFFRPLSGNIILDGHNQQLIDMRTWRRHIAVVPQQVILFSGSLRENICFGVGHVAEERLQEIISIANLQDVVDGMPEGLETRIGENGVQLSGGQRQRIAIARALVRNPQIIILDEATSALDVISEQLVQQAIDRLVQDRTTFIVAHRLSTIRKANRVVVMKGGTCIESGSQEELMDQQGEFFRLKQLQD